MLRFIRDHLFSSVGMAIGGLITLGSRMNDAYTLFNARLPPTVWEAIGLLIFFVSVAVLLYQWHRKQSEEVKPNQPPTPISLPAPGFEFFPDRESLGRATGTLASRLSTVTSASAILVVGIKFYDAKRHLNVIKELLLPNPNGEAIKYLESTIGVNRDSAREIRRITKAALESGADVRWYDHFIFHSIILADIDKSSGWVHIESVLPYSMPEQRPSYTVHKEHSEQMVAEMNRVFRAIWKNSKDAPRS